MASNYVYILRHGATELNDPDDERVRGWSQVPLSEDGKKQAREAAAALKKDPPDAIFTSDLPRAKETAEIVAKELGGLSVTEIGQLRPWHLGHLQGKKIEDVAHQLEKFHTNHGQKVPGGEAYREFYSRWAKALETIRKLSNKALLVVHARNVYSLPSLLTNGEKPIPVTGPPHPGDILKLTDKGVLSYFHKGSYHGKSVAT